MQSDAEENRHPLRASHEQVHARADLLCCCGQVCEAAQLVLAADMWPNALALLRERADQVKA